MRGEVTTAVPGGLLLPKFLQSAAALQGFDLINSLLGGISFVPACDLAQHAKGGGEEGRLADTEQEGVLGLLPAAETVLRETMNVMGTRLEEE